MRSLITDTTSYKQGLRESLDFGSFLSANRTPNVRVGSNCDLRHRLTLRLECDGEPTFSAEGKALPVEPPPRCARAYRSRSASGREASISAGEHIRDHF